MYPRTKYVARNKKFNLNKLDNPFLIGLVECDRKFVLNEIYKNICIYFKNICFLKNPYLGSALLPKVSPPGDCFNECCHLVNKTDKSAKEHMIQTHFIKWMLDPLLDRTVRCLVMFCATVSIVWCILQVWIMEYNFLYKWISYKPLSLQVFVMEWPLYLWRHMLFSISFITN